ncbi:unnamed protein product [Didymodactylos carnosus]|uniref:Radical SAM core domain-containing protein n=1 Tax=Didymodactylos carnosus TaxID=1234261 RepID=A0A814Y145_9BILA|nr:unnamed protein product [Didymodactylos carnosus]CAF3986451.1 unnamed protein product [Didymodactylos carnosus]
MVKCQNIIPLSVNYHLTRACNYKCKFCFHMAITSDVLPLVQSKRGIQMLYDAGMKKINFSGGEPFCIQRGSFVGDLVKFSKELGLATSIVSNGSLITDAWFQSYSKYLDILAISCDSFDDECNRNAGRTNGADNRSQLYHIRRVRDLCYQYNVIFKINSVIHSLNYNENMREAIDELQPVRWKVFQCLLIEGESFGKDALRDAGPMVITDKQFEQFCATHRHLKCFVPESNSFMRNSYLILDERTRFLDCRYGRKDPSPSILDVGVEAALNRSGFDEKIGKGIQKWTDKQSKQTFLISPELILTESQSSNNEKTTVTVRMLPTENGLVNVWLRNAEAGGRIGSQLAGVQNTSDLYEKYFKDDQAMAIT